MSFQTQVRTDMAGGIVGELYNSGPTRAKAMTVDSDGVANTVGHAFTYTSDTVAAAGGANAFAGILFNPKGLSSSGVTNPLDATLSVPDGTTGCELLTFGALVVNVTVFQSGAIGDGVFFVDATGALGSGTASAGQTQIAGAVISDKTIAGVGLAVITLTGA
tara:strand:+ start:2429 stop:2914 length:486 start_codon:yes stop_codon:yes gene_type:complete